MYKYGMRLRGFAPMCQPMEGFKQRLDDPSGKYYDILEYDRKLTEKELMDYELDLITEKECQMNTNKMIQLFTMLSYDPWTHENWDNAIDMLRDAKTQLEQIKKDGSALWYVLEALADNLEMDNADILESADAKDLATMMNE